MKEKFPVVITISLLCYPTYFSNCETGSVHPTHFFLPSLDL